MDIICLFPVFMPEPDALKPAMSRVEIGEKRRAKMRGRLIEAAARVTAERGSQKATIDDFITGAKVSRGTFYNYFATREDLLEALWATRGHDPFSEIMRICATINGPAEHLATMTRLILRQAVKDPTWGWLVIAMSAERATVNDDLLEYPLPDLKAGERAGVFHYDDLACAADLVVGTVRSSLHALLRETRMRQYPETISKMLLIALGVPRSEAHRVSHLPLP